MRRFTCASGERSRGRNRQEGGGGGDGGGHGDGGAPARERTRVVVVGDFRRIFFSFPFDWIMELDTASSGPFWAQYASTILGPFRRICFIKTKFDFQMLLLII